MEPGLLRELIHLTTFNETTRAWDDVPNPDQPAQAEAQGDGRVRFLIRFRDDLFSRGHTERALRARYRGEEYDVVDVIETIYRAETQLIASRRIVEGIDDLASGVKGIKTWP